MRFIFLLGLVAVTPWPIPGEWSYVRCIQVVPNDVSVINTIVFPPCPMCWYNSINKAKQGTVRDKERLEGQMEREFHGEPLVTWARTKPLADEVAVGPLKAVWKLSGLRSFTLCDLFTAFSYFLSILDVHVAENQGTLSLDRITVYSYIFPWNWL